MEEVIKNVGLHLSGDAEPKVKPKRTRKARKLAWNERQYGAGFIHGVWAGLAAGTIVVPLIAAGCKLFVEWLFR